MNWNWKNMTKDQRTIVTTIGIMVGMLLSTITIATTGNIAGHALQSVGLKRDVESIAKGHLDWANQQSRAAADHKLASVSAFFDEARSRTRQFAEETLSLNSKWTLVTDFFTQNQDHPRLLREEFDRLVFSQEQLDDQIKSVISDFLRDVQNIESEMLVRLKADLANLPDGTLGGSINSEDLGSKLDAAMRDAVAATQAELRASVGLEIASFIAGEIVTQASIQLATSSGILGAGALSGPVTFGISTVVGLMVDQIVSEIYTQAFDPAGELSNKVNEHLAGMESLVYHGSPNSPGLIARIQEIARKRLEARDAAIYGALQEGL